MRSGFVSALVLAAVLASIQEGDPATARPEYRHVGLDWLLERARRHPGEDFQLKLTWCGEQTEPIPTVVLGGYGHRLGMGKYTGLRRPRWHYGNDAPPFARYYQMSGGSWVSLLESLVGSDWATQVNPTEIPASARERWHVVFSWTDALERQVACAQVFIAEDQDGFLEHSILAALDPAHPARDAIARLLFLR